MYLQLFAARGIGIVGRYAPLPLADEEANEEKSDAITKKTVIMKLISMLAASTESKLTEKLAITLGYLCVGESGLKFQEDIINALIALDKLKNEEVTILFSHHGEFKFCGLFDQ